MSQPTPPGRERETEAERALRLNKRKYTNRVFTNVNKYVMEDKFKVIRCRKCIVNAVITDAELEKLPRRRTDNAPVLCKDQWTIKLFTKPQQDPVKVKRLKGIETQYRHLCQECMQPVLYQSVPHGGPVRLLYLIESNLLLPKNKWQPKKRCRVCGYIPRDDQHFEEHIRDRGHWDQTGGSFPAFEEKNDTPVNPIIVG
ncbi:hypothetical protein, conserved [Eimeria brunetti]|uniref:STEEP1 domain-containing protein n=1 Tax=Eimeria brunetti TaxID=51314 RepID=U6LPN4_9EIME|nr:hypothetical protein, conserved [Eimeria brunetti]